MADALLSKLSQKADCYWPRFTIMADVALFAGISEIIRLRFPEFSVWHLPIVAHELGHFVAESLHEVGDLFKEIADGEGPGAFNKRTLYEQFADFFAVNALGPAFACSCIFLEFDPTNVFGGRKGHPPDNERVDFILRALTKIDEINPMRDYKSTIDKLNNLWECSLKAARINGALPPEQTARFDKQLGKFCSYQGVGARLDNVRYKTWHHACILSDKLENGSVTEELNSSGHQVRLRDVINAAWHWRLWNPKKVFKKVEQTALELCLGIIESGQFDI